jgi:SWI/SNF-related matrix-associated actin-dependent regulator of chromatin subfamily A member 5
MASEGEKPTTDSTEAAAINKDGDDDDDSDVELEGMDLEGADGDDDNDGDDNADADVDMEPAAATADSSDDKETTDKLATEDQDELEAAHRERTELMAAERKQVAEPADDDGEVSMENKLQYLLSQSEVFAHFLAGSVAATDKKRGGGKKKGSRGKKNRMTEAEEDAQLLKTAESKRSVIRLNKQPSILADHCKMHGYQLEGLNWLIKLHCNGLNGILADEVSCYKISSRRHCSWFILIFDSR